MLNLLLFWSESHLGSKNDGKYHDRFWSVRTKCLICVQNSSQNCRSSPQNLIFGVQNVTLAIGCKKTVSTLRKFRIQFCSTTPCKFNEKTPRIWSLETQLWFSLMLKLFALSKRRKPFKQKFLVKNETALYVCKILVKIVDHPPKIEFCRPKTRLLQIISQSLWIWNSTSSIATMAAPYLPPEITMNILDYYT